MPLRQTTKVVILGCSLLGVRFVILGFAGGCGSTALPPRITADQRALLGRTHFSLTVGVEEYEAPVYSDRLLKALTKAHLFAHVDHLKSFSTPPDVVARIEERIYGTATIPILTGLSLGIIPTTVDEDHGYSFSLSPPNAGAPRVRIRFVYSGPTMLGWWAVVLNALPDRTMRDVDGHPRFIESLGWQIASNRDAIEALHTK
jgi:hypothetical protein